jgi:NAD(P)-dependent dehydrogenase (short-subunit alcohol dehydrogenase family)
MSKSSQAGPAVSPQSLPQSLKGKVALVTGAGSGIGRAVCLRLAREGATLVAVDLNEAALRETVASLPPAPAGGVAKKSRAGRTSADSGQALALSGDVSEDRLWQKMVDTVARHFGGLDLAVNCAGVLQPPCPLEALPEEAFERVMAVNVRGVFLGMRHQIPALRARGGGSIVNLASVAGLKGAPGLAVYAASKHAVMGLTRSAALEVAAEGIRINAVCPGLVATPMMMDVADPERCERLVKQIPVRRLGAPEEIAEAVCWLLSPAASFCTGAALTADGGMTA